jgi:hypothetical protein
VAHADESADEPLDKLSPILSPDPHATARITPLTGHNAYRLATKLRSGLLEIEAALEKFSRAWHIAKGYAQEVRLLLDVNQSLFPNALPSRP